MGVGGQRRNRAAVTEDGRHRLNVNAILKQPRRGTMPSVVQPSLRRAFRAMGAGDDDPIEFYIARAPEAALEWLRQKAEQRRPKLIAIDTFQRFARLQDLNDYAQVTNALDPLTHLASDCGAHASCYCGSHDLVERSIFSKNFCLPCPRKQSRPGCSPGSERRGGEPHRAATVYLPGDFAHEDLSSFRT